MRKQFVVSVLNSLVRQAILDFNDSILAVCAGKPERELFLPLGFKHVTISNLDERNQQHDYLPFTWARQDAQSLLFDDNSFDFVFVSDGIHHCQSPHRAVGEMYRVARKGIIVIEARDSILMRLAVHLNITPDYEINKEIAATFKYGGVNNSHIPNYVYRWTEREFIKTIRAYDPTGKQTFRFYYGLNIRPALKQSYLQKVVIFFVGLLTGIFRKQCNSFALVALKPELPGSLWPWLKLEGEVIDLNRPYIVELMKQKNLPSN